MHKKTGNKSLDKKYKQSLYYSIVDGSLCALMLGVGEYYFGAYALILGATSFQMGFLGSLPYFLGSLFQLFSPKYTQILNSRKKAVIHPSFIRTIIFIPIIIVYLLGNMQIWILIICISLYFIMNYLIESPWTSWMGDLVDDKTRTKYFAARSKTKTIVSLISIVLGGIFLEFIKKKTEINPIFGFSILFTIALISSGLSTYVLTRKEDVPMHILKEDHFTLLSFTKRMPHTNFGKYTMFNIIFFFGLFIAAPFFIVYQMGHLEFTYVDLMIALASIFLGKILFFKVWAKLTEEFGTAKVLAISVFMVCMLPFGWIFFVSQPWHVFILNAVAGIAWSGYELLGFNFIYDTVKSENRSLCLTYLTFYKGVAILLGGFVGSYILSNVSGTTIPFIIIFAVSGFHHSFSSVERSLLIEYGM